jgi:hypothetical protein
MIDYDDPKYRKEERVQRLINKWHFTREEAEAVVRVVIRTKEMPSDSSIQQG